MRNTFLLILLLAVAACTPVPQATKSTDRAWWNWDRNAPVYTMPEYRPETAAETERDLREMIAEDSAWLAARTQNSVGDVQADRNVVFRTGRLDRNRNSLAGLLQKK